MIANQDLVAALQAALAGEHAAVWAAGRAADDVCGLARAVPGGRARGA